MTAPIDYTIRRRLLVMQPGNTWTMGALTVRLFANADTMRWVIQSAGVVQVFRYPRHEGRKAAARIAVTSYILGHYQGERLAA